MLNISTPEEVKMYRGPDGKPFDTWEAARDALARKAFCDWCDADDNHDEFVTDDGWVGPECIAEWLLKHRETVQQFYRATEGGNCGVPATFEDVCFGREAPGVIKGGNRGVTVAP